MERQASTEGYYGVNRAHQNGKLTLLQWQAYEALWNKGPLNKKDLNDAAIAYYGLSTRYPKWSAQVKKLIAFGVVYEVEKNKWDVTSATTLNEVIPVKKPNGKKYKKGVEDLELAMIKAETVGLASPEAGAVVEWLKSKL